MSAGRRVYRLTLRVPDGDPPAVVLLRHALKVLLRCFGLKCLAAEEVPANDRTQTGARAPEGPALE
jgi:hypothetical protein